MSDTLNGRISNNLSRDLYTLEDENNPLSSSLNTIWPSTTLDQVFDQLSPSNKTLRQILDDLRMEIMNGVAGGIKFPVTSVNGRTGDIVLGKKEIGLPNVDNTKDIDKPLSNPQRAAINDILSSYDFRMNLQELYDHLTNTNNPHSVSLEQLNQDGLFNDYIDRRIAIHNLGKSTDIHTDIRNSLARLWKYAQYVNDNIEEKLNEVLVSIDDHETDVNAHYDLLRVKEDNTNKVDFFNSVENNNYMNYPSTRAVLNFVNDSILQFRDALPNVENWIDDIQIIDNEELLPIATETFFRKVYFIRYGNKGKDEVAICRFNSSLNSYYWDIQELGSCSKYDNHYLITTENGLALNISAVAEYLLEEGTLSSSLSNLLDNYYKKEDIDKFNTEFITAIKMDTGTVDGTIRYWINNDQRTMSDDIRVAGLKKLAFLDEITSDNIANHSIFGNHISEKQIQLKHLADDIELPISRLTCKPNCVLGNEMDGTNGVHEIPFTDLATILQPMIGNGSTPGTNPSIKLDGIIMQPQKMQDKIEYDFDDGTCGMRFRGYINADANVTCYENVTEIINSKRCRLLEAGGAWKSKSNPDEWMTLGSYNINGLSYGVIRMTEEGTIFESRSVSNRKEALFDIWIKYIKYDD